MNAYGGTFQNKAIGSNESVIFDDDGLAFAIDDVRTFMTVFPVQTMEIGVKYHGSRTNVHIFADGDGLVTMDAGIGNARMAANGQFSVRTHFNDRHDMMVYRSANPSAPADEVVAKNDFAPRVERQVGLSIKMYLFRVEPHLMGKAISYGHPLVEVVLASSLQAGPYPVGQVYEC